MTKEQCRAARALLGWSLEQLAEESQVGRNTVSKFENGTASPRRSTIRALRATFEAAGVEFIENGRGPGVRLVVDLQKP